MSGTQVSSFAPANDLFDLSKVYQAAQQYQQNQQTLGSNEIEMMARASAGLLNLPEEARAAAYPQVVQQLRQYGFAKNAPEAYPGEARLKQIALLGTSSEKQAEWQSNLAANRALLGPTGTEQPSTGAGSGGGAGGGGDEIYNLPKDQFLAAVAKRESGGDPTALNYVAKADPTARARGATASGKYQMVDSTWRTAATAAGIDVSKYPTAQSAPEALQDQAASKLYDMQGTAPWNPAKWGSNWVKGAGGGYTLQPAGGGGGGGTSTTAAATPPGATTPPAAPPASPFGAGAFAPPTRTVAAAPATTANAPNVATNLIPPVNSPQMVAAQAVAARTGKPAPIEGTDGLFALPGGGVSSGPTAGGLGRSAAANAIIEGQQTAATTLPPQDAVLAAGPAAGGGGTPAASQEAPVSAFGGGAFATPPPNMLAPGAPGVPPAAAAVPPVAQNQVAPATPAPAPAAPAPAPAAPAPAVPRLQTLDADNLTAQNRAQLRVLAEQRGMKPAELQQRMQQMGQANVAAQERALADYDRAQTAARGQQGLTIQQQAAEETRRQHQIENEARAKAAQIQQQQEVRAQAEFDQKMVEAGRLYPGKSADDADKNILLEGSKPDGDPTSVAYRNAYTRQKYKPDNNGNTAVWDMSMFKPPTDAKGAVVDVAPTVTKPAEMAPAPIVGGMLGNATGQSKLVRTIAALEAYPGAVGAKANLGDFLLQRTDPEGVKLRADVSDIAGHQFHDLSGAAVSPTEAARLKFIPSEHDTATALKTKLQRLLEINRDTMLQSYRTYGPENGFRRSPAVEEAIIDSIPQPAIDHLRGDMEKGREARFDKIFGKGAAKLVLSNG